MSICRLDEIALPGGFAVGRTARGGTGDLVRVATGGVGSLLRTGDESGLARGTVGVPGRFGRPSITGGGVDARFVGGWVCARGGWVSARVCVRGAAMPGDESPMPGELGLRAMPEVGAVIPGELPGVGGGVKLDVDVRGTPVSSGAYAWIPGEVGLRTMPGELPEDARPGEVGLLVIWGELPDEATPGEVGLLLMPGELPGAMPGELPEGEVPDEGGGVKLDVAVRGTPDSSGA